MKGKSVRPISLEMEGFTSFREKASIDFSSLDLFAITGPTGAGKTSIIDAMTYALYGCTPRMSEKQIKDVISQGRSRAAVLFEFSSGKERYRIARVGRWNGRSMVTELRFEQHAANDWVLLADSVTKAKPIVEQIIGLDFSEFTKSVVLPQGRFDEFLKGRADERRQILSDLLDLEIYSRMMKRANQIADEHKTRVSFIEGLLKTDFAGATPENLERFRAQLTELEPQLQPIETQLNRVSQFLPVAHGLRQARVELLESDLELKTIAPKRKAAEAERQRILKSVEDLDKKIKGLLSQLKANTYDSRLHERLSGSLAKAQQLEEVLSHYQHLDQTRRDKGAQLSQAKGEATRLERLAADATKKFQAAQKDFDKDRKALAKLREKYGSPDAIKSAVENLKQLSKQEKNLLKLQSEFKAAEDEVKRNEKELASAQAEAQREREKWDRLRAEHDALIRDHSAEALKPGLRPGEPCPVCEQTVTKLPRSRKHAPLEEAKRRQTEAEKACALVEKRMATLQGRSEPLDHGLKTQKALIAEATESVRELTEVFRSFSGRKPGPNDESELLDSKKEFEAAQRKADESSQQCEQLRDAGSAAAAMLKDQQYTVGLLEKEISGIDRELGKLQKDCEKLGEELGELSDLKKVQAEVEKQERARSERDRLNVDREKLGEELSQAKDAFAAAHGRLEGLEATRKKVEEAIASLLKKIQKDSEALSAEFTDLKEPAGNRDEAFQLDERARQLQSRRHSLQADIITLRNQIKTLEEKLERAADMRQELEQQKGKMADARTLAQALHGDEFIAFIQHEAYRRLAADGSVHLETLSSGRYSFTVEKEDFQVIDHWNADEPRPVTTLSGGETFLASLALALALAEGLSGMSSGHTKFALESLFLDEGFGTLDSETLETVVAGIEGLSAADRLIGIISHIPDLAERMPARIQVRKSVGGSTIEIS
jgi:DNA repair protein SbcC/Rad50